MIDQTTTTRKRQHESDDANDVKRKDINDRRSTVEHTDVRFDFLVENDDVKDGNLSDLLEKLYAMKQQLNEVKSLLSDKDIAEWNRHTAYMNVASTIVPYLREKLQIEVGTQAWAKMFEILANFSLINCEENKPWRTLHLCEAPGAFIAALNHFLVTRDMENIDWRWFAQTLNPYYEHDESTASMLIDDDRLIFHTMNEENHWNFGIDNTGNLMSQANIDYYISHFRPMGFNLITADGSFDVQNNPGEQECLVYPLLKTEVYIALSCLLTHGNFVLKLFTTFEKMTVDLIYLLYRMFSQISMFKPKTSKKGNSEMYVVCMDFQREKFVNCFTTDVQLESVSYPASFLTQLHQCAQLFESYQINTIQHNLYFFQNLNRRFMKKLHKLKQQTLDRYLNECQVRQLLDTDRHLIKADQQSKHIYLGNQRITRIGTFHNQHQIEFDIIRKKIQSGFFCLTCTDNQESDLCSLCQTLCQIIDNPLVINPFVFVGQIVADKPMMIDLVYGKASTCIRNSCFSNRYLLELCSKINTSNTFTIKQEDLMSMRRICSLEISHYQFEQLQLFLDYCQMKLQSQNGTYYIQSGPILTRLQASVIYLLARVFEQTSVYLIPSSCQLVFLFEISQNLLLNQHEYETVMKNFPIPSSSTLLQFIDTHQLLDQQFASHLIQANNMCLQVQYVTSNIYSQPEKNLILTT
ncbi:unnamed protein product [Adineta ricciae]|uniref:Cap-specific mRNA (nucleoside-2'-O-)-methyltransferase 2 n=1 Tax=Adineta ricciae TaxID=249248 RepID=A0A815IMT4_ADIRI|nr:unnamed protein product [Adineta ricciae]